MKDFLIIVFFVALCVAVYFIRKLIYKSADKATDAVVNAVTRKKNANNPPKAEKLADQYKNK